MSTGSLPRTVEHRRRPLVVHLPVTLTVAAAPYAWVVTVRGPRVYRRRKPERMGRLTPFRPHPDVLTRRIDDHMVLVHMGRNEIFSLNPTGARLWELLVEGRSREDAVGCLQREFEVTAEVARKEADELLAMLAREGLAKYDERPQEP